MLDITDHLADEHAAVLAALPVPMTPVCVRSLLNTSARDQARAEARRKSGLAERSRHHNPRAARLTRSALRTRARAGDLLAEVR